MRDGRRALVRLARPADATAMIANTNRIGAENVCLMIERFTKTVDEERRILGDTDVRSSLFLVAVPAGKWSGERTSYGALRRRTALPQTSGSRSGARSGDPGSGGP